MANHLTAAESHPRVSSRWPQRPEVSIAWVPLVVLPLAVICLKPQLAPWAFMWALAAAIFAGCKWQTYWSAPSRSSGIGARRALAYLFLWPGMEADAFLRDAAAPRATPAGDWFWAVVKTVAGATLLWGVTPLLLQASPLAAGWVGMFGLIFLLHFGTFHLLALVWRSAGVNARPIMRAPLAATSLAEFWGRRWNLGFRELTHTLVFRPLLKRFGPVGATFAAFAASGLIHDLAISFPAGGGYGLPTAYFLLQGLGVLLERSSLGRRLHFGDGLVGRSFTLLFTAGPLYWLFHPAFVGRVILPFAQVIGAI